MQFIKDFFAGIATLAELAALLIWDREERAKYNYDFDGGEE